MLLLLLLLLRDAKENREKKRAERNSGVSFRVLLAPGISRGHFFFFRVKHDGLIKRPIKIVESPKGHHFT